MIKTEKRVLLLTSVLVAIALNVHRLFVLLPGEARNIGLPWVFNAPELVYQTLFQFGFCTFFGYLNLAWLNWNGEKGNKHLVKNLLSNVIDRNFCGIRFRIQNVKTSELADLQYLSRMNERR